MATTGVKVPTHAGILAGGTSGWASTVDATLTANINADDTSYAIWTKPSGTGQTSSGLEAYGFDTSSVPSNATINSVTVSWIGFNSNTSRLGAPTYQLWDGTSAQIGSTQTGTNATSTSTTNSFTFTGVSYSQLANLRVRIYGKGGTTSTSGTFSVDYVTINVDYTKASVTATKASAWNVRAPIFQRSMGTVVDGFAPTVNVPYPASIAAGDVLFMWVNNFNSSSQVTAGTTGWTKVQEFILGNNDARSYLYRKDTVTGSESGNVTLSVSLSGAVVAAIAAYAAEGASRYLDAVYDYANDTVASDPTTGDSQTTMDVTADDLMVVLSGNDSVSSSQHYTSVDLSASGVTFDSLLTEWSASSGRYALSHHRVLSGTVSGPITWTADFVDSRAGGAHLIRLRSVSSLTTVTQTQSSAWQVKAALATPATAASAWNVNATPPANASFDTLSSGTSTTGTSVSWSHTCASNATLLIVAVHVGCTTSDATATTTVTYAGQTMTSKVKRHSNDATAGYIEVFELVSPAPGTNSVAVTRSGGTGTVTTNGGAASWIGAAAATYTSAIGTTNTPAITVASASNGQVMSAATAGTTFTNNTQTLLWRQNDNSNSAAGNLQGTRAAGTGSNVEFSHTISGADWWAIVGVAIPAGATTTPVTATQSSAWNVESDLTTVTATCQTAWNVAAALHPWPTTTSGRNILDQNGNPYFIAAYHTWNLMGWGGGRDETGVGTTTPHSAFDAVGSALHDNGHNALLVLAITSNQGGETGPTQNGNTWDGVAPWASGVKGDLNEEYWARVDDLVDTMAGYGITVYLFLISSYTLYTGTAFAGMTGAQATTFGTNLGNRYKDKPNIVWGFGADYFDSAPTQVQNIVTALAAAGDTHLVSVEFMAESSSTTTSEGTTLTPPTGWDFSDVYSYNAAAFEVRHAWTNQTKPVYYSNGPYYNTGGASGNHLFSDLLGWAFTSGSQGFFVGVPGAWGNDSGYMSVITGADWPNNEHPAMIARLTSLPGWGGLVPDLSSTFVTSSRGTDATAIASGGGHGEYTGSPQNDYMTAAVRADGMLGVIYTPVARTGITIDTSKLVGSYTVYWIDPHSGAITDTSIAGSYNTPGNNSNGTGNWFLVFEGDDTTEVTATRTSAWNVIGRITATANSAWHVKANMGTANRTSAWRVLSTVPQATSASAWRVLSQVPTTRTSAWHVKAAVPAATGSTAWRVLSAVPQATANSAWRVLAAIPKQVQSAWDVLTTVPPSTRDTAWKVNAQITATRDSAWNVAVTAGSVTATQTAAWHIKANMGTASAASAWRVLAALAGPASKASAWRVLAAVPQQQTSAWHVKANIGTATTNSAWDVLTTLAAPATAGSAWRVLANVGTASKATAWKVNAQVNAFKDSAWNVQSALTTVTATRTSAWSIVGRITATLDSAWNVAGTLTAVTSTRAAAWHVKANFGSATAPSAWDVLTTVPPQTAPSAWRVLSAVPAQQQTSAWKINAQITATRTSAWNVASAYVSVTQTKTSAWKINAQITGLRDSAWTVKQTLSPATQPAAWDVLTSVPPSSRAAAWRVLAQAQQTKTSAWKINARLTTTQDAAWDILTTMPAATQPTAWRILVAIPQQRATAWKINAQITKVTNSAWNVSQPLAQPIRVLAFSGPALALGTLDGPTPSTGHATLETGVDALTGPSTT